MHIISPPETRTVTYLDIDIIYPNRSVLSYTLNLTDGDTWERNGNTLQLKRAEDGTETEVFLSHVAVIESKTRTREERIKEPKRDSLLAPGSNAIN